MRRIDHRDHGGHGGNGESSGQLLHADLTSHILDAAIKVHKSLGPGLLESAYEVCLFHELHNRGLSVRRQVDVPIRYDGVLLESGYRIDLLINETVVVEIKSIEKLAPIHDAQLLTYLRLSGHRVGLLINFNVEILKSGVRRKVF